MSQTGESRVHIKCPKCGQQLHLREVKQTQRIRCPACKHVSTVSPTGPRQTSPMEYDEESIGTFPKVLLGTLGALGIALVVYLIYAAVLGPESPEPPAPVPVAVLAKNDKPKPPAPATKPASRPLAKKVPKTGGLSAFDIAEAQMRRDARDAKRAKTKPSSALAPLSPEDLFAKASPAVVYIVVRDKNFKPIGLGSGFFIDSKGLIVTNHHVIKDAEFATVTLSNKTTLFVSGVTATDPDTDLALLKVSGEGFPCIRRAGDALPRIGSTVYAIGNPKGFKNTFSNGMVSGHREVEDGLTLIQTTAAISRGSSGGPLLNAKGEVLGVTSASVLAGQNLNFAVPISKVAKLLRNQGKVKTLASAGGKRLDKEASAELDKAWAAMRKKDWRTATTILTSLRKTQKDNPFVWFALGYLHSLLGNNEIAVDMCKKAIAIEPDCAHAYFIMGGAYISLKRYTAAIAAYKKAIAIKPDFAEAYWAIGRTESHLGNYGEAIAAYKKAIAINPDFALAYSRLGDAYCKLKRYKEAIPAYKKAIAIKPDYADAYFCMGDAYFNLKQYADAIAAYKKAIAIKPDLAVAYQHMGGAYVILKRYDEAIAAFKKAIALDPDFADAYLCMGDAYYGMRRYSDAIAAQKKAIALKPDYARAYYVMGLAYLGMNRDTDALAAYKKAVAVKPDYADAYFGMGVAYGGLKRYAAAIAAYKQYLRLEPKGVLADAARKAIRKLEGN